MTKKQYGYFLIITATLVYILSLFINYFVPNMDGFKSMKEISQMYPTLLTPANYTFAIWGVIYTLGFCLLISWWRIAVYKDEIVYKYQIIYSFIAIAFINSLWIVVWSKNMIALSWIMMSIIFGVLIYSVIRVQKHSSNYHILTRIFFDMYLGWISVAFSLNTAILLIYFGVPNTGTIPLILSIGLIFILSILAMMALFRKKSLAFPLVIMWAFGGIAFNANSMGKYPAIVNASLAMIIFLFVAVVYYIMQKYRLNDFDA